MTTQTELLRQTLYRAAMNCPHEIERGSVTLFYDEKQPGHNALAQLGDRLASAALAQPEQPAPLGIRNPYFAHSPEDGFEYFATQSEALEFASRAIAEYKDAANFDGEWSDDVEGVRVGIVTHVARCDGDEKSGYDYEMTPLSSSPHTPQAEQVEAAKPESVGINGLTKAETSATASVMGLVKPETERAELINALLSLLDDQMLGLEEDQEDIIKEAAALLSADSKSGHAALLRMLCQRARSFPNFPMGYHMPEVFRAVGEEPPEPADSKDAGEPVAWVRRHPDGALTAEFLEDAVIEPMRKKSGAWVPLYLRPQAAELAALKADMARQATEIEALWKDADRLSAIQENSWALIPFEMPTGQGDADVGWRVVGYYMAVPREREIGIAHVDDPRSAIDAAMQTKEAS